MDRPMGSPLRENEAIRFGRRRLRATLFGTAPRGGIASLVVAGLVAAAVAVTHAVRMPDAPPPLEDGSVVLTDSGELYLVADGVVHPLPNVTSARLLADDVVKVPVEAIDGVPRGRPRGIAGAPSSLPARTALMGSSWQLCTDASEVDLGITITFGAAPYLSPASGEAAVLDDGAGRWLVRDGHRAPAPTQAPHPVIATIPELTGVLPIATTATTDGLAPGAAGTIACAQSDPAAPFARPSAAAIARSRTDTDGVVIEGPRGRVRLVLPQGAGVLGRQQDEEGYWLLTSSGELAPIADERALTRLGYDATSAVSIPSELIALLPAGPELSVHAAGADR